MANEADVSNLLGFPASGEGVTGSAPPNCPRFPIYWVSQRVGSVIKCLVDYFFALFRRLDTHTVSSRN